jgi:hypothetical protein
MKAEHRKELQTNELADWLGRTYQSVKSGNRNYWIGGVIVVAVAAVIGYFVYQYNTAPSASIAALMKLQTANTVQDLEKIAQENTGTVPARTARFEVARILYQEGVRDLPSAGRSEAIGKLTKARGLYQQLADECRDSPVLAQEAVMWQARIEESLSGASDPEKPNTRAGSIDEAIQLYQKLALMQPESFETKAAAERAKFLQDNKSKIEAFYATLNQPVPSKLKQ